LALWKGALRGGKLGCLGRVQTPRARHDCLDPGDGGMDGFAERAEAVVDVM